MDPLLTPEQNDQLRAWASQRDAILSDIATKRSEYDALVEDNKKLAASNGDIQDRINQGIGRLKELDEKEKEYETIVSSSLADLTAKKTRLETEVSSLEKEVISATEKRDGLAISIDTLIRVFDTLSNKMPVLDSIVDRVTKASLENERGIQSLVASLAASIQRLIDINEENASKGNLLIGEIPRVMLELQKKSLERPIIKPRNQ